MNLKFQRWVTALIIFCGMFSNSSGQESRPTSFWPDNVRFDASITTPEEFLGFEIGQRHLDHAQLAGYLMQLAEESPRLSIEQYGQTYGGRPLLLLTVSSATNLENLETIGKRHRQLANPDRAASVDIDDLPAVINMGYGVHGDEASATNCSAVVAFYLAAAKGKEIETWLKNCVILLDPSLNPDGFNRFANWVNNFRGRKPNDDPQHREHNQGWPSGRVNYYWFDLNRDWLPLEHPESRARMQWYHQWKPNVVLDFHEMGTNTTYFFQPGVPSRTNPFTPARNVELTARFGQYHGRALDQQGSYYFTQERFDDFYMGKGSTYPDLHGAVGILFEQASARGHVQQNQDGRLTFHKAIANQFATSLSSLRASSDMRAELLDYKREFYQDSVRSAEKVDKTAFVFSCRGNSGRLNEFANVLIRHDIDCYWPKQDFDMDGKRLTSRSLVVPVRQAEYRFLKSLLMRRKNFKENVFYDVSSWTLPLAYGLSQSSVQSKLDLKLLKPAKLSTSNHARFKPSKEAISYLIDWREDASCQLLNRLLENEINVKVATRPFSISDLDSTDVSMSFEPGTLLVQMGIQDEKRRKIERLLVEGARRGTRIYPAYSGLTPIGVDLGSDRFRKIEKPAVVMPVGPGIAQYEAGEIWHLLDHRHGVKLSMLNVDRFSQYDLRQYSTFLLPSGSYKTWGEKDWEAIADEIRYGATAIAIGSSCEMIRSKLTGRDDVIESNGRDPDVQETQLAYDSASRARALKLISGAILNTRIDRTHPLYFGFPADRLAVFRNHNRFLAPSDNPYHNPAIYDVENPHLAGYCSEENVEKLKTSASVVVVPIGKGRLIQISDNPNFRAFWRGTSRLFLNAIFFGEFTSR